ncbi:MAG: YIP1 family protein [Candidatus Thorarchaeota archaeon]|nr:YIP1 family protein [Candidatus Thorarchaeota archaeon]
MVRRCAFCGSPVPADATVCPVCKETIAEERLERLLPMLKRPEAPDVRMMGPLERLWGVIRRPAPTYRDIGHKPDAAGPLIIIILNALIITGYYLSIASKMYVPVNVNGTIVDTSVLSTSDSMPFYAGALASIVTNILLGMVFLILGTGFAHLAFKITGGTGGKMKTLSIVGYSIFPVVLFRLAALVVLLAIPGSFNVSNPGTWAAIVMAIHSSGFWIMLDYATAASFAWVGFLLIFGIREAHDTSTEWAFLVSLACMIVLMWTFWQVH